jgi:enoyl-CoA hydratase
LALGAAGKRDLLLVRTAHPAQNRSRSCDILSLGALGASLSWLAPTASKAAHAANALNRFSQRGLMSPVDATDLVRVSRRADLGLITLTRVNAINALTMPMVSAIDAALRTWASDDGVTAVLIDGDGARGLCAGADVKFMREAARTDPEPARAFWRAEYRMNALIAGYGKPVCSLMHGIVLGGGVGLSAHASHRVVTDNSAVGMPETGIGMIPDVGGTWLLSRGAHELGTHLALTGASIGSADAIRYGLADHYLGSDGLAAVRAAADAQALLAVLRASGGAEEAAAAQPAERNSDWSWVAPCYAGDSITEILARLQAHPAPAAQSAAATILSKSPSATIVTLRALRAAARLPSLSAALDQEYRLVCRRLVDHDFSEGVRAQLVDKDRHPQWQPGRLADVNSADVESHFAPRPGDELGLEPA